MITRTWLASAFSRLGRAAMLAGLVLFAGTGSSAAAATSPPWHSPLGETPVVLRGFDPPQQRWLVGHRGVDLAAALSEPVKAPAAGTVSFAGRVAGTPVVSIDHVVDSVTIRSTYEPVIASVLRGQRVVTGDVIGRLAGGVFHCAQPCLHWGARQGRDHYLNPMGFLGGRARLLPRHQQDEHPPSAPLPLALITAPPETSSTPPSHPNAPSHPSLPHPGLLGTGAVTTATAAVLLALRRRTRSPRS